MKNINIFLTLLLLGITIVFSSCKKDKEAEPDKEALLVNKAWKLTAATIYPGLPRDGGLITNYFNYVPVCEQDNLLVFNTDNTYYYDENSIKCDASAPQVSIATWYLNADKKVITLGGGINMRNIYDVEVNANTLKYKYVGKENGAMYTVSITRTAQ